MRRKKLIGYIFIAVIVIFGVGSVFIRTLIGEEDEFEGATTVQVWREYVESRVPTNGVIVPKTTRTVSSDIAGKVKELCVKEGDSVVEGQLLLRLDSSSLSYQVAETKLDLATERKSYELAYEEALVKYEEALRMYSQKKTLYEASAVSQSDYESAKQAMEKAYCDLTSDEKDDHISPLEVQYQRILSLEMQLKKLRADLEKTDVVSPLDGVITSVDATELDVVTQGSKLMVIEDITSLEIVATIGEYDISDVKVGQTAIITSVAFPKSEYTGTVSYIAPVAVEQGGETVVEARIDILDPGEDIKPYVNANVEIVADSKKNVLAVPYEAIFVKEDGTEVIRVKRDEEVIEYLAITGIEGELLVEVLTDGIEEGDEVIIESNIKKIQ